MADGCSKQILLNMIFNYTSPMRKGCDGENSGQFAAVQTSYSSFRMRKLCIGCGVTPSASPMRMSVQHIMAELCHTLLSLRKV